MLNSPMENNGAMDMQTADAGRYLSEARLTGATFTEAASAISCAWFRVLVRSCTTVLCKR